MPVLQVTSLLLTSRHLTYIVQVLSVVHYLWGGQPSRNRTPGTSTVRWYIVAGKGQAHVEILIICEARYCDALRTFAHPQMRKFSAMPLNNVSSTLTRDFVYTSIAHTLTCRFRLDNFPENIYLKNITLIHVIRDERRKYKNHTTLLNKGGSENNPDNE